MFTRHTERLVIKPHTQDNLEWLNATSNDPGEDYFNGDAPPRERPETLEETQQTLDAILQRPQDADIIDYAIHKRDTDELIGCGMIARIDQYNRRCMIGISLGWNRENWGKGYASEMLRAMLGYCFNDLEMHRVGSEVYAFNEPSIRMCERNGFTREGTARQAIFKDGVFKDVHYYSLLREEWEQGMRARSSKLKAG
jgi:[ribosomal protein S5]-alanine N-acetyltransferase